jgi:hypothetical protein
VTGGWHVLSPQPLSLSSVKGPQVSSSNLRSRFSNIKICISSCWPAIAHVFLPLTARPHSVLSDCSVCSIHDHPRSELVFLPFTIYCLSTYASMYCSWIALAHYFQSAHSLIPSSFVYGSWTASPHCFISSCFHHTFFHLCWLIASFNQASVPMLLNPVSSSLHLHFTAADPWHD